MLDLERGPVKVTKGGGFTGLISNVLASGVSVNDPGGIYGSPGTLTLEEILALIGAGLAPGAFLTVIGGGKGTVYAMGSLGATETIDLGLGNYHWGTLDQACTVTFTAWTAGKDCQITVETIEDGTGGWGVTWTGVTWIGGTTPTPDTAAGTVTHYVFFSRDGGTTIYGALVGSGTSSSRLKVVAATGATELLDLAEADVFDLTLDANCTITLAGATSGQPDAMTVFTRQGGSGSKTVTWPASVQWRDANTGLTGAAAPTLYTAVGALDTIILISEDGGTTWGATHNPGVAGASSSAISALGFVGPILISDTPSTPLVFADLLQTEAQDDLLYADV